MSKPPDVTALLVAWSNGDEDARDLLIEAVYDELRRRARGYLRRERPDHSLSPTALVHEAYLKLVDQRRVQWQNRAHFFAIAGARDAAHPGGSRPRPPGGQARGGHASARWHDDLPATDPPDLDVLALDAALDKLAAHRCAPEPAGGAAVLRGTDGRSRRRPCSAWRRPR